MIDVVPTYVVVPVMADPEMFKPEGKALADRGETDHVYGVLPPVATKEAE